MALGRRTLHLPLKGPGLNASPLFGETEVFNLDLRLFSGWTKITDMPKMVGFFHGG